MGESVSFKTYLKRDGQDVEVRRFGIDSGAASNFMYLRSKIQAMFPSIQNDQFTVFWQDNDKDYIAIGSDEELLEALTSGISQPFKLFVNITSGQQPEQGVTGQPEVHPGITCDSCEQAVVGFRYKCVTCPDFDLCASCEGAGRHPEHFMLRMPFPLGPDSCHPRFFRKFIGRPHKFHKFARRHPQAAGFAGGRCPFTRPQGSGAPAPGEPDIFNFSALMEFINSMTGASPGQANEPAAEAQTSANSQATPGQQAGSQEPRPPRPNTGADYLNGIGNAITAFLDPFDLPVKKKSKLVGKLAKKVMKKNELRGFKPGHGRLSYKHHFRGNGPHGHEHGRRGPNHGHYHGHYRYVHGHERRHRGSHGSDKRIHDHEHKSHTPTSDSSDCYIIYDEGEHLSEELHFENGDGIDVTFDVRTPTSQNGETPAAPQQTAATTETVTPTNIPQQNAPTPPQQNIPIFSQQSAPVTAPTPPQQNIPIFSQQSAPVTAQQNVPVTPQQNVPVTPQQTVPVTPQQTVPVTAQQNGGSPAVIPRKSPTAENQFMPVLRDTTPLVARRNSDDWTVISRESPTRSEVAMDIDVAKSSGAEANKEAATSSASVPQPSAPPAVDADRQRMQEAINNIRSMGFNYETRLLRELLRQENGDIASVLETILNNSGKN